MTTTVGVLEYGASTAPVAAVIAVMVAVEDFQHSQVDTDSANSRCF